MSKVIDDRTKTLDLPLPNPFNDMDEDVIRIRESFKRLDSRSAELGQEVDRKAGQAELDQLSEGFSQSLAGFVEEAREEDRRLERQMKQVVETEVKKASQEAAAAQATADAATARLVPAGPQQEGLAPEGGAALQIYSVNAAGSGYAFQSAAALQLAPMYTYSYSAPTGTAAEGVLWFQIEG